MTDLKKLIAANAGRWKAMKVGPTLIATLDTVSARLVAPAAKAQYVQVSGKTTVPWFIIAVIHERESSQSWKGSLAQGDPWNKVSIHVPAGRVPFVSCAEAAVADLENAPPGAASWHDWTVGGALTLLEEYNGLGY